MRTVTKAPAIFSRLLFFCLPLALLGPASSHADTTAPCRPIARLSGESICQSDVSARVGFRIYRKQVDVYSLLKEETERLVDQRVVAAAAARAGLAPEAFLAREIDAAVKPVGEAEVDRYLSEHAEEAAAAGDAARGRVLHYLSETRRIELRLALLERLRSEAGYALLLEPPEQPRIVLDVAGAPTRGGQGAPVTIVHYANLRSRSSARSVRNLAQLVRSHPGAIRWVHRHFPMERDELGLFAAQLAFAAHDEGRFWQLHDRLFALDGHFDEAQLLAEARTAGLAEERIERARLDTHLLERVRSDIASAQAAGAIREPTLFINGRYFSGLFDYTRLEGLFLEELERASGRGQ